MFDKLSKYVEKTDYRPLIIRALLVDLVGFSVIVLSSSVLAALNLVPWSTVVGLGLATFLTACGLIGLPIIWKRYVDMGIYGKFQGNTAVAIGVFVFIGGAGIGLFMLFQILVQLYSGPTKSLQ